MPTKIVSINSGEHYKWGGRQGTDCDGWHLLKTPELSIIEELMPAGQVRSDIHTFMHASSSSCGKVN
jgi:hypothetical protein